MPGDKGAIWFVVFERKGVVQNQIGMRSEWIG